VLRRNRLDRDAGELERRARLGADDALARDAGLGHHVDDRRRDDEHGPRRRGGDRGGARRVEVVDVLVRAEHEVDVLDPLRPQRALVRTTLPRREEGIDERRGAIAPQEEPRLAQPRDRDLAADEGHVAETLEGVTPAADRFGVHVASCPPSTTRSAPVM
jgi:hypothetical protein